MKMQIPNRITKGLGLEPDEVVSLIIRIAESVGPKYSFGYYDEDDMIHECIFLGYAALEKFEVGKGELENFVRVYMSNRVKNFKRKHYYRLDTKHADVKMNLMNPIDISQVDDEEESSMQVSNNITSSIACREIFELIDRELPVEYRQDYLRIKDGMEKTVPIKRRKEIMNMLKDIVGDTSNGMDDI